MTSLTPWLIGIGLNTGLLAIAWFAPKKLLTPAGLVHAWFLGVVIWGTLGWPGYGLMMAYFLLGSGVTRLGKGQKEAAGIAEKRGGARGPENVWGSALIATFCALAAYAFAPIADSSRGSFATLLILGYVASMCTKLSDTCGTEIGKAYGKRTFLITTFQPVPAGTEGAVSLEGTLAGIGGSIVLAVIGWAVGLINPIGILFCIVAALVATSLESVIGATIEAKLIWLTHDLVNIINTLIGAIVAIVLALGASALLNGRFLA